MKIPHWAPPTHAMQIFRYAEQGSINFLCVSCTNPDVFLPELHRTRDILEKEDPFVVVQDIFLTETARLADVVLPAATWGEKTGTYTNTDRTGHLSEAAVRPPGEAKHDLDIFLEYARRMDFRDRDSGLLIEWGAPRPAQGARRASRGAVGEALYTFISCLLALAVSGLVAYAAKQPLSRRDEPEDLPAARDLLRDHELEYVSLEDHEDGHHDGQTDRPLQHQAQEVALLALEACGARAYGEVLRADHLPKNATRGVGADGQVGAQPDLLGRDLLEVGEQGVRRSVRARECHPEPPYDGCEEREQEARGGGCETQGEGYAGVIE
jgi:anaerobic selenocysteine-containing dehydrogenase